MTGRLLLLGRAAGTILAGPLIFLAACLVEMARQVRNTVLATWQAQPEDPEAARKREAQEQRIREAQGAAQRREERRLESERQQRELESASRVIGAIREREGH